MAAIPSDASMPVLWAFGFVYGLRHALEPDHLATIGTLVRGGADLRRALAVGVAWGLGHAATLSLAILAAVEMPELIGRIDHDVLEVPAAAMMFGFGLWCLLDTVRGHAGHRQDENDAKVAIANSRLSGFTVGMAHGLCGGGVVSVMISAALPSAASALAYAVFLGAGSAVGMATMTMLLALPNRSGRRMLVLSHVLSAGSGIASVLMGISTGIRALTT